MGWDPSYASNHFIGTNKKGFELTTIWNFWNSEWFEARIRSFAVWNIFNSEFQNGQNERFEQTSSATIFYLSISDFIFDQNKTVYMTENDIGTKFQTQKWGIFEPLERYEVTSLLVCRIARQPSIWSRRALAQWRPWVLLNGRFHGWTWTTSSQWW